MNLKTYIVAALDYFFDLSTMSDECLGEATMATQRILVAMQKEQAHRDYQRMEKIRKQSE